MTCIVGIAHEGAVYIGADSAGTDVAGQQTRRADTKTFHVGPFAIGYCGSFRMGQLLRFGFNPPAHPDGMDTYEYMASLFIEAVRERFKAGGFATKYNDAEYGGFFLVGYLGRLFQVEGDYQVGESLDGYDAIGSGGEVALGALYATDGADIDAEARIGLALEAACHFNAQCREPFTLVYVEPEPKPKRTRRRKAKAEDEESEGAANDNAA